MNATIITGEGVAQFGTYDASRRPMNVVFDCPGAYPLFDSTSNDGIGGAEVRAVTFARRLSQIRPIRLEFVVASDEPRDAISYERIKIHFESRRRHIGPTNRVDLGLGWRRISRRLISSLDQRMMRRPPRRPFFEYLRADAICSFGVGNRTASVVRSARRRGIATIVFLTSDRSLDDMARIGRRDRGAYGELGFLCRYALRNATAIVVQKKSQQDEIGRRLNLTSYLIRNPLDLATQQINGACLNGIHGLTSPTPSSPLPECPYVLWIGRADTFSKRADVALDVARRVPGVRFLMIMNRHDDSVFDTLVRERPNNVQIVERVPFSEVDAVYAQASVLLNTSDAEGFPNSILQAGKHGIPTISLNVDPDRIFRDKRVGFCAEGSLDQVAIKIKRWMRKNADYRQTSRRVRKYVQMHHALDERCDELWSCICEAVHSVDHKK